MKTFIYGAIGAVCLLSSLPLSQAADTQKEQASAYQKLQEAFADIGEYILDGRMREMSEKSQAAFPAATRTGVECLVLGNALFQYDPKASYELHKQAAAKLPDEPDAQYEWAMEQHRAGECAGAADSYAKFIAANPEYAPAYGLLAECLLRGGKTQEAVDTWMKSEKAKRGTLETLESLVCEVHRVPLKVWERADFVAKAKAGDIDAAEQLVVLDCDFEMDWWNRGPCAPHLKKDLEILNAVTFKEQDRAKEMICAAEAALANVSETGKANEILKQQGLLFDEKHTLPKSDRLISAMIAAAEASGAVKAEDSFSYWGPAVRQRAAAGKNADVYNAAAHLYLGSKELAEIEREAWTATAGEGFAVAHVMELAASKELRLDHPDLIKARKLYPNDFFIAHIVVTLTEQEKQPLEPALIQAILAEYSHFSLGGALNPRYSARALRAYFHRLDKELGGT